MDSANGPPAHGFALYSHQMLDGKWERTYQGIFIQ
jgi:hypothetical protein